MSRAARLMVHQARLPGVQRDIRDPCAKWDEGLTNPL